MLLYSVVMLNEDQLQEVVKELHKELGTKESLSDMVATLLTQLDMHHTHTLVFLIIKLCSMVPEWVQNHVSILHLLVSNLDGALLQFVVSQVIGMLCTRK